MDYNCKKPTSRVRSPTVQANRLLSSLLSLITIIDACQATFPISRMVFVPKIPRRDFGFTITMSLPALPVLTAVLVLITCSSSSDQTVNHSIHLGIMVYEEGAPQDSPIWNIWIQTAQDAINGFQTFFEYYQQSNNQHKGLTTNTANNNDSSTDFTDTTTLSTISKSTHCDIIDVFSNRPDFHLEINYSFFNFNICDQKIGIIGFFSVTENKSIDMIVGSSCQACKPVCTDY